MYDSFPVFLLKNVLPWVVSLIVVLLGCSWYSSNVSANIYNEQHGTHYTALDFFWAGEQINAQTQTVNLINK